MDLSASSVNENSGQTTIMGLRLVQMNCLKGSSLPGGIGTLKEFFEALTWNQLGYHAKPCGLLDMKGYYTCLAEHTDRMVLTDATPNGLLDQFETYDPPQVDKWIEKKKGL